MSDLISRQAAIDALDGEVVVTGKTNAKAVKEYIQEVSDKLKAIPSAEVEPVKTGKWIHIKKRLIRGGYVDASECSVCHKRIMPHFKPNYRPNCGARMDL